MQGLDVDKWPPLLQIAAFFGVALATAIWAIHRYIQQFRRTSPEDRRKEAEQLVLTAGTIADMGPVREAAAHLKRLADIGEEVLEEQRKARHVYEEMRELMTARAAFEQGFAAGRLDRRS